MRVSAVQFRPTKSGPAHSLARLVPLAEEAAAGADLVVLPEMASTGYVFSSATEIEPMAEACDGPTFQALAPVARGSGAFVVCGFVERDGARLFNSALVIDPRGELAFSYRKTMLFEADESWALPGDSGYRAFETRAGRFGVGICMDLNDERFVDWIRGASLRAVALPTNWLDEGESVWGYWAWRMKGTGCALVAANSWGEDGAISFRGESAIIDRGRLLAAGPRFDDVIVRAELG